MEELNGARTGVGCEAVQGVLKEVSCGGITDRKLLEWKTVGYRAVKGAARGKLQVQKG